MIWRVNNSLFIRIFIYTYTQMNYYLSWLYFIWSINIWWKLFRRSKALVIIAGYIFKNNHHSSWNWIGLCGSENRSLMMKQRRWKQMWIGFLDRSSLSNIYSLFIPNPRNWINYMAFPLTALSKLHTFRLYV